MKKWKENRGSITLFVLIAILFFVAILMGIYVSNTNKQRTSQSLNKQILDSYENDVNKIDEIYQGLVPSVPAYPDELEYKEGTIDEGLVVIDSNNNEYVWIPVENPIAETEAEITSMVAAGKYPIAVKTSGTDANGRQNYRGVLYDFGYDSNNTKVSITPMPYSTTSGNREPSLSTPIEGITQTSLQEEYNLMVEKVNSNKGFYIGRYESSWGIFSESLTLDLNIKPNIYTYKLIYSDLPNDWKEIYQAQKQSIGDASMHMIWGSQYDQVMIWMKDVPNPSQQKKADIPSTFFVDENLDYPPYPFYVIDSRNMGNLYGLGTNTAGSEDYKIKNVYDLAGNVWELTLEESDKNSRVVRGGSSAWKNDNTPFPHATRASQCCASVRCGDMVVTGSTGSRVTLY